MQMPGRLPSGLAGDHGIALNVVMFTAHAERINRFFESLDREQSARPPSLGEVCRVLDRRGDPYLSIFNQFLTTSFETPTAFWDEFARFVTWGKETLIYGNGTTSQFGSCCEIGNGEMIVAVDTNAGGTRDIKYIYCQVGTGLVRQLWGERKFNTILHDSTSEVRLRDGMISLPAGVWRADITAPASNVGCHQLRLKDDGAGKILGYGTMEMAPEGYQTRSRLIARFDLPLRSRILVEHRFGNAARSYDCKGVPVNRKADEVYALAVFEREGVTSDMRSATMARRGVFPKLQDEAIRRLQDRADTLGLATAPDRVVVAEVREANMGGGKANG
jgi:hypothetical protein